MATSVTSARTVADSPGQRRPIQQFHHKERQLAVLADVVDRTDVRVAQRRGGARLTLKAIDRARVLQQLGREKLDRHLPAQARVLGTIDDTHAAFADLLGQPVVCDGFADHQAGNIAS